jgi:hypothetical protein
MLLSDLWTRDFINSFIYQSVKGFTEYGQILYFLLFMAVSGGQARDALKNGPVTPGRRAMYALFSGRDADSPMKIVPWTHQLVQKIAKPA